MLAFISFVSKRSPDVAARWPDHKSLDGFHLMMYLQSLHSECYIDNGQLRDMLAFVMREHVQRMADSYDIEARRSGKPVFGPRKATNIFDTLSQIMVAFTQSVEEKERQKTVRALS